MRELPDATVLLAEDDVVSREMVSRMLTRLPVAEVLKAADGIEAIECIERVGGKVDAAILDFSMPRMHGLQVLKRIRIGGTSAPTGLPCIMLTGHSDSRLHGLAKGLGVGEFVEKPATFSELKAHLEHIMASSAPSAPPDVYRQVEVDAPVEALLEMADAQGSGGVKHSAA